MADLVKVKSCNEYLCLYEELSEDPYELYSFQPASLQEGEALAGKVAETFANLQGTCLNSKGKDPFCVMMKQLSLDDAPTHVYASFNALSTGDNVILISRTGEARLYSWLLYAIAKMRESGEGFRVLLIQPTKVYEKLSYEAIKHYLDELRINVVTEQEIIRDQKALQTASVIIVNPAFLLAQLKRGFKRRPKEGSALLGNISLIVVDNFDSYDIARASLLLRLLDEALKHGYLSYKDSLGRGPQILIITVSLDNTNSAVKWLYSMTQRNTVVIVDGMRKIKDTMHIVIGKISELKGIFEGLALSRLRRGSQEVSLRDLLAKYLNHRYNELLSSIDGLVVSLFRLKYDLRYRPLPKDFWEAASLSGEALNALRRLLFKLEIAHEDIVELLINYLSEDEKGLTLVFSKNYKEARTIYNELIAKCSKTFDEGICRSRVKLQEDIIKEYGVSNIKIDGVKIVIVETSMAVVDLGTLKRVVHTYIPDDPSEFIRREGVKYRSRNVEEGVETIIFPIGNWPVLISNFKSLKEWLKMGFRLLFVDPNNPISELFIELYECINGFIEAPDRGNLLRVLLNLESCKDKKPELKNLWNSFNFYSVAPLVKSTWFLGNNSESKWITLADLVTKYQTGNFYGRYVLFVNERVEGGKVSYGIFEVPIRSIKGGESPYIYISADEFQNLINIIKKYKKFIKKYERYRTDEQELDLPRLVSLLEEDVSTGFIKAYVLLKLKPLVRHENFMRVKKEPIGVVWSFMPPMVIGDRTPYPAKEIEVNAKTFGSYDEYTYVYMDTLGSLSQEPDSELPLVNLSLAYIMVMFRKHLHLPLSAFSYIINDIGPDIKVLWIIENEPIGLRHLLNSDGVTVSISRMVKCENLIQSIAIEEPDDLTEAILSVVDPKALRSVSLINKGNIDWNEVKRRAIEVLHIICGTPNLALTKLLPVNAPILMPEEPRLVAYDSVTIRLTEGSRENLIKLCGIYDHHGFKAFSCNQEETLYKIINERLAGHKIKATIVFLGKNREDELKGALKGKDLNIEFYDVAERLKNLLKEESTLALSISQRFEVPISVYDIYCSLTKCRSDGALGNHDYLSVIVGSLASLIDEYRYKAPFGRGQIKDIINNILELAEKYLESSTKALYEAYLVLEQQGLLFELVREVSDLAEKAREFPENLEELARVPIWLLLYDSGRKGPSLNKAHELYEKLHRAGLIERGPYFPKQREYVRKLVDDFKSGKAGDACVDWLKALLSYTELLYELSQTFADDIELTNSLSRLAMELACADIAVVGQEGDLHLLGASGGVDMDSLTKLLLTLDSLSFPFNQYHAELTKLKQLLAVANKYSSGPLPTSKAQSPHEKYSLARKGFYELLRNGYNELFKSLAKLMRSYCGTSNLKYLKYEWIRNATGVLRDSLKC